MRIPTPNWRPRQRKPPPPRGEFRRRMHDLLFEQQRHLDEQRVLVCANTAELDLPRYRLDMSGDAYLQRVPQHVQTGRRLGVRSTPGFFVNGAFADVPFGMQHLHEEIDRALAHA
jgi:predicted DsbA family dithiol-disulfide isomerase